MPYRNPDMKGPIQDPYQKAAYHVLDGDLDEAWRSVEDLVKSNARSSYEPDHSADEDGEWVDYDKPALHAISDEIANVAYAVGDAIWEIATSEQGMDDASAQELARQKAEELEAKWAGFAGDLAGDLVSDFKDDAGYSRDPHAYYGVSRRDFF